ncbi:hypothetical protein GGR50DRAFT_585444 [Xylaria sp. CBS 124048]|nr:hypothetical protein GGR50DRAFT_585444 [Xylaria sp. CBS 124048]
MHISGFISICLLKTLVLGAPVTMGNFTKSPQMAGLPEMATGLPHTMPDRSLESADIRGRGLMVNIGCIVGVVMVLILVIWSVSWLGRCGRAQRVPRVGLRRQSRERSRGRSCGGNDVKCSGRDV